MTQRTVDAGHSTSGPRGRELALLSLGTLGVVYGDIGTSPLYAIRECFHGPHAVEATADNILGVLSLIFWSLVIVISVKYLVFILRADNRGEGGILALTALVLHSRRGAARESWFLVALGLFGASLLYGDGMITPAISVLSAVEGLEVATPVFQGTIIPITVAILVGLFLVQPKGTGRIGVVFGPITLVWFVAIAATGVFQIAQSPGVLAAVDPSHGFRFFLLNGWYGLYVLGAVFLVVTGGEALYADMGHFGRRPIRLTWFCLVLPALLINYFGQGAFLMRDPGAASNPFYRMVPSWGLYPMLVLATLATVIASQAVISGSFSLTMQAVHLGYSPRLRIQHTSAQTMGQIYVPTVNWGLMLACVGLVLGFRSSSNLAAAYGIAVTATMVITTVLFFYLVHERWGWSLPVAIAVSGAFLVIDLSFFAAATTKILHGGWFPLAVSAVVFTLMSTWKTGRRILAIRMRRSTPAADAFVEGLALEPPARVPGTAVYMYGNLEGIPPALVNNLKHNKVLHERVVILSVQTRDIPRVSPEEQVSLADLGKGFYRVTVNSGFMDEIDIPHVLQHPRLEALEFDPEQTSFIVGRETIFATEKPGMALWREKLFAAMARNALSATRYFDIPRDRVLEVGAQVEI